jgi:hypothetical protein
LRSASDLTLRALLTDSSLRSSAFTLSRLKEVLLARRQQGVLPAKLTALESFALGAFCKSIATVVTYPYIMAKVRLQARRFPLAALAASDGDETTSTLAPRPGEDSATDGQSSYAAVAGRAVEKVTGRSVEVGRSRAVAPAADGAIDVLRRVYAAKVCPFSFARLLTRVSTDHRRLHNIVFPSILRLSPLFDQRASPASIRAWVPRSSRPSSPKARPEARLSPPPFRS